ncbi:MAG: hypothetical protein FJ362_05885 [Gemmatimonadetes bacterium]|nr:hypothetical protein [Gemmatimonadota bacterium]
MITVRRLLGIATLAAAPALVVAQRPLPPVPPLPPLAVMDVDMEMAPGMQGRLAERLVMIRERRMGSGLGVGLQLGVTRLLNLRRQLELTSRQATQLDSIERGLFTERKALIERMQGQRRALQQPGRPMSPDSMRARMQQLQPQLAQWRQRDSVALASAERLLTEPQRQKLREIRAYARGRADAIRQSRAPRGGQQRPFIQGQREGERMPAIQRRPPQGMPRGTEEVGVEIRRDRPGQEVIIERRMTRPPV